MSEFPGVSLNYGNGLMLCKVVLGSIESISMDNVSARTQVIGQQFDSREVVKDGVAVMYVIENSHQILPYCFINLQYDNSPLPAQNNLSSAKNNIPSSQNRNVSSSCSATSSGNMSSNVLHLPSTYKANKSDNTENYKEKIQELEKYVERF